MIKFEDIIGTIAENADISAEEYAQQLVEAKKQACLPYLKTYFATHPEATEEEIKEVAKEFLMQTPDELTRNLRIVATLAGTLFNQNQMLLSEIADFKQLYSAVNFDKIQKFAKKIAQQQAEEQHENSD